jgi:hypothetical protein
MTVQGLMKRSATGLLLVALFGGGAALSYPQGRPATTSAHYKVTSRGFTVGEVSTTQRSAEDGGVPCTTFETRTRVSASFLWLGCHVDTVEKGTIQNGELVSYSRKGRDNGVPIDVEGQLVDAAFRFVVREKGRSHAVVIPRGSYDYTTMECPEARIDFNGKGPVTLRLLDVERLTVVKREYRLLRTEQYAVAGKEYPCRVVDYSDPNKTARRWISWDGTAVTMFRQDGKGEKHSYSVQAVSLRLIP